MKLKELLELWLDDDRSFGVSVFSRYNGCIRDYKARYYGIKNDFPSALFDYEIIGFQFLGDTFTVNIAEDKETLDAGKLKKYLIWLEESSSYNEKENSSIGNEKGAAANAECGRVARMLREMIRAGEFDVGN